MSKGEIEKIVELEGSILLWGMEWLLPGEGSGKKKFLMYNIAQLAECVTGQGEEPAVWYL